MLCWMRPAETAVAKGYRLYRTEWADSQGSMDGSAVMQEAPPPLGHVRKCLERMP